MITSLTENQIKMFPEIMNKWVNLGLHPEYPTIKTTADIGHRVRTQLLKLSDVPVLVLDSPLACWLAVCMFSNKQLQSQMWSQVGNQVENQVGNQVKNQVGNQVWSQVKNQVESQVGNQVWSQVWNQVWSQVWNQVWSQVGNQVRNQVGYQIENFIWPYIDGHWYTYYFAWVNYLKLIGVNHIPILYNLYEETIKIGLFYPLKNITIIGRPPIKVSVNDSKMLHKDLDASIEYADGWKLYYLNGVSMKEEYVMTESNKLDPGLILKETNVEVRRELLRKIGIERFLSIQPNKVLESKGNYTLLEIKLSEEVPNAKYLRMLNPSIGCWHVEGVAPECDTIKKALNFRAGQFSVDVDWNPDILT